MLNLRRAASHQASHPELKRVVYTVCGIVLVQWLLRDVFAQTSLDLISAFDKNKDSQVSFTELDGLLRLHGISLDAGQLREWVSPLDADHDNLFEAGEIDNVAYRFSSIPPVKKALREMGWRIPFVFWMKKLCSVANAVVVCALVWLVWQLDFLHQDKRKNIARKMWSVVKIHKTQDEQKQKNALQKAKSFSSMLRKAVMEKQMEQLKEELKNIDNRMQEQKLRFEQDQSHEQEQKAQLQKALSFKEEELEALRTTIEAGELERVPSGKFSVQSLYFLYASPLLAPIPPDNRLFKPVAPLCAIDERNRMQENFRNGWNEHNTGSHCAPPEHYTGLAVSSGQSLREVLESAGEGAVLHLALHGSVIGDEVQLLLEDATGRGEWMDTIRLRKLLDVAGGCQHLYLCFLSCCHGESFGREFLRAGCRYVICLRDSAEVRDGTARLFVDIFYAKLGAGNGVSEAFNIAVNWLKVTQDGRQDLWMEEAENFLLLESEEDEEDDSVEGYARRRTVSSPEHELLPQRVLKRMKTTDPPRLSRISTPPTRNWRGLDSDMKLFGVGSMLKAAPPPGLEDFFGRESHLVYLLGAFKAGRRCACVYGPAAIGKSSFVKKFVHFACLPGRIFAHAIFVDLLSKGSLASAAELAVKVYAADPERAWQSTISTGVGEAQEVQEVTQEMDFDGVPDHLIGLLQRLHELHHRGHSHGVMLLAFDDLAECVEKAHELEVLLEKCSPWLYLLTAAITPWKTDLLGYKVEQVRLDGLGPPSAAKLLMKRARRHFTELDFRSDWRSIDATGKQWPSLQNNAELEQQLMNHPKLISRGGNPQQVRRLAERIAKDLRSLYEVPDELTDGASH